MPWTWQTYPDAMKNLPTRVRHKAIEIANALVRDGYDEARAISIAISTAKEWVEAHPPRKRKPSLSPRARARAQRAAESSNTSDG